MDFLSRAIRRFIYPQLSVTYTRKVFETKYVNQSLDGKINDRHMLRSFICAVCRWVDPISCWLEHALQLVRMQLGHTLPNLLAPDGLIRYPISLNRLQKYCSSFRIDEQLH